jgi:hypothetical protein
VRNKEREWRMRKNKGRKRREKKGEESEDRYDLGKCKMGDYRGKRGKEKGGAEN